MENVFFDSWPPLLRVAVSAVLAYATLVVFLRISGRRTLSKMNAFDLIVTVALGSTLASTILSKDVTIAQGSVAFIALIGVQYAVTWSSVRVPWVRKLVTGEPALILHHGVILQEAMRKARVNQEDLYAAVRASGEADLTDIQAVVLETNGEFSVLTQDKKTEISSLKGVKGIDKKTHNV